MVIISGGEHDNLCFARIFRTLLKTAHALTLMSPYEHAAYGLFESQVLL